MNVLLVEPDYRRGIPSSNESDDTLWYPPISLLKLATFHKSCGDTVKFVRGFSPSLFKEEDLFSEGNHWDRIYITTLFTYHFDKIVQTINQYKAAIGGNVGNIFVGGIMASLMPDELYEETGIYPITGILNSSEKLRLNAPKYVDNRVNIDLLPLDYEVLADEKYYAVNETIYAYTSRGCTNQCPWCGVPRIEPEYLSYIDIKPFIREMRGRYGDLPKLKLMDNNVLPSPYFKTIIEDLLELGYGKGETNDRGKQRTVDFNQGLDASHIDKDNMELLSQLNIKPMRIAFDRVKEKVLYTSAVKLAANYGIKTFSNYMLYNWKDSPKDLYERLTVNILLNENWKKEGVDSQIYSYPMRFAPIDQLEGQPINRNRDYVKANGDKYDLLKEAVWTKRFIRNIEIIKGAAHGAISPTASLALRAIGQTYEEYICNLYMPEELLRNRNRHEKKVYPHEPKRKPGTGKVEEFRDFILRYLKKPTNEFWAFHRAISENSSSVVKEYIKTCKNATFKGWANWYLKK